MEKNGKILVVFISLSLIIILSVFYYVFNVYETEIEIKPKELFADNHSVTTISIYPVNALGLRIPFRKINAGFEINEGKDLVEIVKEDDRSGCIVLRAKNKTGKVVVYVKSKYSLLPSLIEINVYPNTA
ncbi:MAG: hypothetical protein P4L45_13280 [Ignavibacteriaceae bacterium]|nr:hypothetical protein [Ignavibacteriaceae bacterium]